MKLVVCFVMLLAGCAGLGNLGGQQGEPSYPVQITPNPPVQPMPMPARPFNCSTRCYVGTCYTQCG